MSFFTQEDFDLMAAYANQPYNKDDANDQAVNEKLKLIYDKVDFWARRVCEKLFNSNGVIDIRKATLIRGKKYQPYFWARIYPNQELTLFPIAYIMSIDAQNADNLCLYIKIDTIDNAEDILSGKDSARVYCNNFNCCTTISAKKVITLDVNELVDLTVNYIQNELAPHYEKILKDIFHYKQGNVTVSIPTTSVLEHSTQPYPHPLNLILYGPPGTGKTYHSINHAVAIIEGKNPQEVANEDRQAVKKRYDAFVETGQIVFTTFHQNYSYEEFVQGLRPSPNGQSTLTFERRDGIFLKLCKVALENKLLASGQPTDVLLQFEDVFEKLIEGLPNDPPIIQMKSQKTFKIIKIENRRIQIEISSGSTTHKLSYNTVKDLYETNQNYNNSGYGVYINPLLEKLREKAREMAAEISTNETPTLTNYVLLIDEINRANISRVFGELITLIEDSKRWGADEQLRVTLPSGEKNFCVPNNLYIVGTMNTADKSIALLDLALRRRFEFQAMYPDYSILANLLFYGKPMSDILEKLNNAIYAKKKSPDFFIGHAFFIEKNSDAAIENVFEKKVIPLLSEYFQGNQDTVEALLKDATVETVRHPHTRLVTMKAQN